MTLGEIILGLAELKLGMADEQAVCSYLDSLRMDEAEPENAKEGCEWLWGVIDEYQSAKGKKEVAQ